MYLYVHHAAQMRAFLVVHLIDGVFIAHYAGQHGSYILCVSEGHQLIAMKR